MLARPLLIARDGALRVVRVTRRLATKIAELGKPTTLGVPSGTRDVAGKAVLITGSTRGIGRAAAELFAQRGAKVAVHGRSKEGAEQVAALLRGRGAEACGYGGDLAREGQGTALVASVIADLGGLDILINNGAVLPQHKQPPWLADDREFNSVMATNLAAPFETCMAAVAWMQRAQRPGRILNISSSVADLTKEPALGLASYGISKIALEGLSTYLVRETAGTGIEVVVLRVPTTNTEMIKTHVAWESRPLANSPEAVAELYLWAATAPSADVWSYLRTQSTAGHAR
jgi:NAD(P)-dependent dehydrogenase (short-subunit alcohol dehydrogenase family)